MLLQRGMQGQVILLAQQRLKELGFFKGNPKGNYGPLTEEAVKAFQKSVDLPITGIIDDVTWGRLFDAGQKTRQSQSTQSNSNVPPWLLEALKDLGKGVEEISGPRHNPDIVAAHQLTSLKAQDDETPWCSAILCAWMERAGIRSTRSAAAASWRNWGQELPEGGQRLGCVVVMTRPGGNHVSLYLDEDDVGVYCLGGNQGNRVSVRRYPWEVITNFRWPI